MRIFIEEKEFDLPDFIAYCQHNLHLPKSDDWRRPVFEFFDEWHNSSASIIVNTSGSTGEAKTVSLQKKHVMASAKATLQYLNIQPGGLAWLCLPANYIAGKMMIVRALVGKLDLFISKPGLSLSIPTQNKIDLAAMVPSQISHMAAVANGFNVIEKSICHVLIGGATIPQLIEDQLKQLSGTCLWHTYGMTETISHIALRKMNGSEAASFFTSLPGVSVSINDQGCLVIDYPSIGVANLHTHDLATLNSSNTFSIEGRNDFIINSGGIKLNPIKIEQKLEDKLPCPFFITGLPDPIRGEKAVLCVENKGDLLPKICSFWKIIENELQKPEIPQEIIFLDYFIRSENGKLKRQATSMLVNKRFE